MKLALFYLDYDFNVEKIEFKRVFLFKSILRLITVGEGTIQIVRNDGYKNNCGLTYNPYGYELSPEEEKEFIKCKYILLIESGNCIVDSVKELEEEKN